jgi:hypothetical protein
MPNMVKKRVKRSAGPAASNLGYGKVGLRVADIQQGLPLLASCFQHGLDVQQRRLWTLLDRTLQP